MGYGGTILISRSPHGDIPNNISNKCGVPLRLVTDLIAYQFLYDEYFVEREN
jgi:hypothetical protein